MTVLITGASGFMGSAIALHLRELGCQVVLLLRSTSSLYRLRGRQAFFEVWRYNTNEEIASFVRRTLPDVVIHTACSYGRHSETFAQLSDANIRYGQTIMLALISIEKPVTFINTGTVLNFNVSPYALTKHQFSKWGRFLANVHPSQLRFINVLLQHMYGPGDDLSKFTTHVINACHHNEKTLNLTAGDQRRDFIYIDDVVSAYSTLLQQRDKLEKTLDIEVGTGVSTSIREFVQTVHRLTSSCTELQFGALPYRPNEPMHCQANINRMRELGWQPKFELEQGLKRTIELEFMRCDY
jgi:CDP-paratose synthetase